MNTAASFFCLVCACASVMAAQSVPAAAPVTIADVYVLSAGSRITSFTAAANGHLTPTATPSIASTADSLALNGKWLFTSNQNTRVISSYRIAANGSLSLASTYTISATPMSLFLDHTGQSLYANVSGVTDNGYETFSIDHSNGKLTSVSLLQHEVTDSTYLTFTGNNQYAYGGTNYQLTPVINNFMRQSNGPLVQLESNFYEFPPPPDPNSEQYFVADAGASDPYSDLVVGLNLFNFNTGNFEKSQLAVFTADKFGNLSTNSTATNMALNSAGSGSLAMSPRGYYLAATGAGLQVFLMHGGGQVTPLTGAILPGVDMGRAFWDNNEQLYVPAADKLYVFSVGTAGVKQVAGSPYSVPGATALIVLPKH